MSRVTASYTDGHATAELVTSPATNAVANVNDEPAGAVTIAGTIAQGETLTASNTLADADGLGTISYLWKADGSAIAGKTNSSLVLAEAQVGKIITVTASYTDGHATAESVTSAATSAIANVNDASTGAASIEGTATQGETLTLSNTLADPDGLGTLSYQWKADGNAIAGETNSSLVLAEAQVGKAIAVTASYTDGHSSAESTTSIATGAVANVNDTPAGTVTIEGVPTQGQTLTASNTLADADGLGAISYQWKANGGAIAGVASDTLVLTEAQVGKVITVTASYTDGHATAESIASIATDAVANVNDAGSVSISGEATQGKTLTATASDADGLGTLSYQWLAEGSAIAGETSSSLVLAEAQVGKPISVNASYTDAHGTAESVTSAATTAIVNVNDAPTGAVSIEGTATQGETLTVLNTLADADGLGTISYQWQADGNAIAGATNSSLVLAEAQVGKAISVGARYIDGHASAESVLSSAIVVSAVPGKGIHLLAYNWKTHTLLDGVSITAGATAAAQTTGADGCASFTCIKDASLALSAERAVPAAEAALTDQAVNLQDAIGVLKLIVGLEVNGAGKALSPYQAFAADYDGNGQVQLSDAIGVLKHVVGLGAPDPTWHFARDNDMGIPQVAALSPGAAPAISVDFSLAATAVHVGLVAYLSGDVDGSYTGCADSQNLDNAQPEYFVTLTQDYGLDPAQFGVY